MAVREPIDFKDALAVAPALEVFKIETLADLQAEDPPQFDIEGILPGPGSLLFAYGPPKSGKTSVIAEMAALLAKGEGMFANQFPVRQQLRVLYASTEGRSYHRYRFNAACDSQELTDHQRLNIRFVRNAMPNLWNPKAKNSADAFIEAVKPWGPEVVVLDTLALAMAGGDENTQQDAAIVVENLFRIRDSLEGARLIVPHHSSKGTGEMRGSSVFAGACDAILKFTHNRAEGSRSMVSDGMKDAPEFDAINFELRPVGDSKNLIVPHWLGRARSASDGRRDIAAETIAILREVARSEEKAMTANQILAEFEVKPPNLRTLERTLQALRVNPTCVVSGTKKPTPGSIRPAFHYYLDASHEAGE